MAGYDTSGDACRASTSSWEKRTGVWLLFISNRVLVANGRNMGSNLVKTCEVLEGAGFEEPEPMVDRFNEFVRVIRWKLTASKVLAEGAQLRT